MKNLTVFLALFSVTYAVAPALAQDSCTLLTPGTPEMVLEKRIPGLVISAYGIKREEDQVLPRDFGQGRAGEKAAVYSITFDYAFRDATTNQPSPRAEEVESRYRACMSQAAEKLRGPRGEYLRIHLAKDRTDIPTPTTLTITLSKSLPMYDANHWVYDMDCGLLIHEVLHSAGLVDEYKVKSADCRSIGPRDSLMQSGMAWRTLQSRESVLYPAQFYWIVEPRCARKSGDYKACASETSRSSKYGGCSTNLPASCATDAWVKSYE